MKVKAPDVGMKADRDPLCNPSAKCCRRCQHKKTLLQRNAQRGGLMSHKLSS
jgi:hypothetical protein